jgi:transposase
LQSRFVRVAPRHTALKERDDRDDEIARLKSKVGEITMDNELLYAKIEAGKRPLAYRRSRR